MKLTPAILALLLLGFASSARDHHASSAAKPIELLPGMGNLHHPIATSSPEAQKYFDQGLTLIYGFNHGDAERSFRRAAELDPRSPMPWWASRWRWAPTTTSTSIPNARRLHTTRSRTPSRSRPTLPPMSTRTPPPWQPAFPTTPKPITTSLPRPTATLCANSPSNIPTTPMPSPCTPRA